MMLKDQYDLSEDTIIGILWVELLPSVIMQTLFSVVQGSNRLSFDEQDMITAGVDTTVILVEWAMAEIVRNPGVQQRIQDELDRVIGHERIISEADFSSLPYLECVVKESLRLHPPTPLMLPPKAKIAGYDIPRSATVIVNIWAIARDPKTWEQPTEFRSYRFLEEDIDVKGHDFRVLLFGAGRRTCPGAQLGFHLATSCTTSGGRCRTARSQPKLTCRKSPGWSPSCVRHCVPWPRRGWHCICIGVFLQRCKPLCCCSTSFLWDVRKLPFNPSDHQNNFSKYHKNIFI